MNQMRVLLLDFNPVNNLGGSLQEILRSYYITEEQLRQEHLPASAPDCYNQGLPPEIIGFQPSIVFLIIPKEQLKQAGSLLRFMKSEMADPPIIAVVEAASPNEMFELLKSGATDFIVPPLNPLDILPRLWRTIEQARLKQDLQSKYTKKSGLKQLVGNNTAFMQEIEKITLFAECDVNVLITGESGTGKELFARAIHYLSSRAHNPFIPVNCGAIPFELMENELFGHEKGAFTGATSYKQGLIREADGGTLFLDEIDSLPLPAQVKLLRFLQEREYRLLGSAKIYKANVRTIAASNIDLEIAMNEGRFRQDLYYRLNVIPLRLPALRERPEDIPLLANHFLSIYAKRYNKRIAELSSEAMQFLMGYQWPGNVRELEHIIQRAVILCNQEAIHADHIALPDEVLGQAKKPFHKLKEEVIAKFEKSYIQSLLATYDGNISRAARAAQKNRRAFWQLIHKHQIDVQSFKANAG
jgi:DNA-binding NtrC family response regulator